MQWLIAFPSLLIPFILYNLGVFVWEPGILHSEWFVVPMMSGAALPITGENLLILLGLCLIYFEVLKSTRSSYSSMLEQAFSMLVFILFLVEFLMFEQAGTGTFLILTTMQLLDVMAGFTITVSTARRDMTIS